jgi:hypothetical protein
MTDGDPLTAYAAQVLAGTGLTPADVTAHTDAAEGSAAHALRHGWDTAARAATVDHTDQDGDR